MAQKTIAQYISGIRGDLKLNNADTRIDDRHIYLKMVDIRATLINQSTQWIMSSVDIFQSLFKTELIEVDTVEACGVQTKCKIKRTKDKLPIILEDDEGPLIKRITSLDGSIELNPITSSGFLRKLKKSTYKYDKNHYFWFSNGYAYFPDIEWDYVFIEAYFDVDIENGCEVIDYCRDFQENKFRIPERMVNTLVAMTTESLLKTYVQIPQDTKMDKNENSK